MSDILTPSNPFDPAVDASLPKAADGDAYNYASMGYRVFRCVGKKPSRGLKWKSYASADTAVVSQEFQGKKAKSNIAIVVPEDMVVIDIDDEAVWKTVKDELKFKIGKDIPCARTGGGGRHLWFRLPSTKTHGNQRGNLPPGIDVRGGGLGYLIAPPSIHPDTGKYYEWLPGRELRPRETVPKIPGILFKLITGKLIVPSLPAASLVQAKNSTIKALKGASEGDRNETLNRQLFVLARKWAGGGRDIEELRDEFQSVGEEMGLAKGEVAATIASALKSGADRPISQISLDSEDKIPATPENIGRMLHGAEMHGVLGYNVRKATTEILAAPPWSTDQEDKYPRSFEDTDAWELAKWLNRLGCAGARQAICGAAAAAESKSNKVDHVVEYLESLPAWDNTARIDNWLVDYCGAEPIELNRQYAAKTLIGAVARAMDPGCKMDTCLVMCGRQGARKSSVVAELAGGAHEGYHDAGLDFKDDVRLRKAIHNGQWLHEIKEIDQFSKVSQGYFKDILDTRIDSFIPKYGRFIVDLPRRSIFIATTNVASILRDPTGSRRYWPVMVKDIYYLEVRRIRDQLWAEAKYRYERGEAWWLEEKMDETRARNASEFEIELVGMESILRYVRDQRPEYLTFDDVANFIPRNGLLGTPQQHFGAMMKELGWERERVYSYGRRISAYKPPKEFYEKLEPVSAEERGIALDY